MDWNLLLFRFSIHSCFPIIFCLLLVIQRKGKKVESANAYAVQMDERMGWMEAQFDWDNVIHSYIKLQNDFVRFDEQYFEENNWKLILYCRRSLS